MLSTIRLVLLTFAFHAAFAAVVATNPNTIIQKIGYGIDPLVFNNGLNVESSGIQTNPENANSGSDYFAVTFSGSATSGGTLLDTIVKPIAGQNYSASTFFRTAGPSDSCNVNLNAVGKPFTGQPFAISPVITLSTAYSEVSLAFTAPNSKSIQLKYAIVCDGASSPSVFADDTTITRTS